ncbi:PREDICTED: E3 ubiquitin-protein ligase cblA-like [Bactrocera latifrons]|uniref:E3 ubiquitin-protein ligase cblA-like n=1 Tax=Bactrocera latifrons TaxID=174628 RepID=UPI0008DE3D53|nr:PREDICTED: E3 ubiquitin-protein ligase cblA-like [Bactrocera latifrons]
MLFADEQTSFPHNLKQLANTHHHNNNNNSSCGNRCSFVDATSTPPANHSTAAILNRRTAVLRKAQATQIAATKTKAKQFTENEVSELLHALSAKIKIALETETTTGCRRSHCNTHKPRRSNNNTNNKNYIHNNNINEKKSRKTDQPDDFMGRATVFSSTPHRFQPQSLSHLALPPPS